MAHARPLFLSALASACFLLGLAPGCSGNSTPAPATAIGTWTIAPGLLATNGPTNCGAGAGVTWSIGNPEADPIETVSNGGSFDGIGVSVSCTVSPDSGGFSVSANVSYGTKGSLTIEGQIPDPNGNATPPTATGVSGAFSSGTGYVAALSDANCTVTFTANPNMGIGPGKIWGTIDCPNAAQSSNMQTCEGKAEFLFENCGQ